MSRCGSGIVVDCGRLTGGRGSVRGGDRARGAAGNLAVTNGAFAAFICDGAECAKLDALLGHDDLQVRRHPSLAQKSFATPLARTRSPERRTLQRWHRTRRQHRKQWRLRSTLWRRCVRISCWLDLGITTAIVRPPRSERETLNRADVASWLPFIEVNCHNRFSAAFGTCR